MSHPCEATRRALLRDDVPPAHLAECAGCRAFARSLGQVDLMLATESGRVPPLPEALRARIVQATLPAPVARTTHPTPDRGRGVVLEMFLRIAAVAAVFAAVAVAMPGQLLAAEVPLFELGDLTERMSGIVSAPDLGLGDLDPRQFEFPVPVEIRLLPLAVAAAVLAVAGGMMLRREPSR